MSVPHTIVLTDVANRDVHDAILHSLVAYNASRAGPNHGRPLVLEVRDEAGAVIGGLWGYTSYGWLFTELFVLPAVLRGQGIGREMLRTVARHLRVPGQGLLREIRLRVFRRTARLSARPRAVLHAEVTRRQWAVIAS
jgi:GNAT superfamily N-acetyltransferase